MRLHANPNIALADAKMDDRLAAERLYQKDLSGIPVFAAQSQRFWPQSKIDRAIRYVRPIRNVPGAEGNDFTIDNLGRQQVHRRASDELGHKSVSRIIVDFVRSRQLLKLPGA